MPYDPRAMERQMPGELQGTNYDPLMLAIKQLMELFRQAQISGAGGAAVGGIPLPVNPMMGAPIPPRDAAADFFRIPPRK